MTRHWHQVSLDYWRHEDGRAVRECQGIWYPVWGGRMGKKGFVKMLDAMREAELGV